LLSRTLLKLIKKLHFIIYFHFYSFIKSLLFWLIYRKNGFAEVSKNFVRYKSENNFVEPK